ncbi:thrombospondin related sporozoite protein, putative [Plasmodium knowlesi strain H]|uniref:Thrombospondin related sporozoite protein, putative n=3 Tax=Plasmodium knowlesi TaxID=5850 RepID=A0A5K1U267_PLAKH|nr:thrombospondin-related sporozoite protein, putative [Plasmodium knowlesi strain H]OTN66386.1 putative Thrombospondin related sporozoite protein [Plasmodium knowlesi]CAA9986361.1 thrombospondin-related sporozoite protein, putative [Plasmodium knowlesi strain H]SBO25621.1 thrombospondin related sporozoite protein, putative [Plasmodium knowlesi strain H]SBO28347.1 thrombospondin related sporozoite protein, putative [Plasmodium knowlesi strain H]VVS75835.1 thrombospondin-related sporozoite prot|eukprot:XP_002257767.1 hypothetical protein, conserved in Plasmodium species [Plasmodium knowlesi strain H]
MWTNSLTSFFLLCLISAHLNFFFGQDNHSLGGHLTTDRIAHNEPALRNRMLQEAKPYCDQWTEWSDCSKSCGMGVKMRVRTSSQKEHSRECSNIKETAVCFNDNCAELMGARERDEKEQRENEIRNTRRKYLLIFGIFSAINIVILLVCVIMSIKRKVI